LNRTWVTRLATLLAVSACVGASAAYACTYSPIQFRAASELVPVSGPIVIEILCQETDFCATGSIDTVTVTGPGGAVPGTFDTVRGGEPVAFLVWRPAMALEAGTRYAVRISALALLAQEGPDGPLPLEVHADEAFRWAQGEDPTWRFESVSEDTGERLCCFAAQACFDHCFTEERAVKVTLSPALPTAPRHGGSSYALRWTEADGTEKRQILRPWQRYSDDEPTHLFLRAVFEQPAERYCATLEVRDLDSGATQEFGHCESAERPVQVGRRLAPVLDQEALRDCQVPPGMDFACDPTAGPCEQKSVLLQRAWCEANQASCADGKSKTWQGLCEKHAALCANLAPTGRAAEQGCHVFPARPLDALVSYGPLGLIALAWRRRAAGLARRSRRLPRP